MVDKTVVFFFFIDNIFIKFVGRVLFYLSAMGSTCVPHFTEFFP